jgi:hypothetical protein
MPAQKLVRGASRLPGSDCPSLFIAGASFGPDIPTCDRKENLTIPHSEDRGMPLDVGLEEPSTASIADIT